MDIKEYLNSFTNPKHVHVTGFSICIDLNKNIIDLQDFYDKVNPSYDAIQFVSYEKKYKTTTEVSKEIKKKIAKLNKDGKNKPFFKNCVICKFNKNSIKIFKTGKIHITTPNDPDMIDKNVKIILSILETNIASITIVAMPFLIRMKSVDLTNVKFNNDNVQLFKQFNMSHPTLKYKKITCTAYPTSIVGYAKSYKEIQEFADFIKDFIEFEDKDQDQEITIDDDFIITINI